MPTLNSTKDNKIKRKERHTLELGGLHPRLVSKSELALNVNGT
jgi:hypothetical protein